MKEPDLVYGAELVRCLIIIGWSERELGRRIGATQATITRTAKSKGTRTLNKAESARLREITKFMSEHPMPRRKTPSFLEVPKQE